MKLRVSYRKLYDYVLYDLKEIAFLSSLPDLLHIKKQRKLTWRERWYVLKEAYRLYAASWVWDIGPDLRPNDDKKVANVDGGLRQDKTTSERREPDLAVVARGGTETLRPALQRVYMMRASAYRNARKSFIQWYKEGIKQVMEGENSHAQENDPKKSS